MASANALATKLEVVTPSYRAAPQNLDAEQ
ncbi:MAG: hypothetical protein AVDCRST_MAG90-1904, partial [uncultured Microvirga sp.]